MAVLDTDLDHILPSSVLPPFWAKLVVGSVAIVCFARSYDGDFVFDDSEAIVNNKHTLLWRLHLIKYLEPRWCSFPVQREEKILCRSPSQLTGYFCESVEEGPPSRNAPWGPVAP
ncbi:TMTC4 isoform 9 [Pan troglodytes]|uniref:Transmembrane O-mannosyltransferase targeting cadherins 4 n=3 Tax=Pan TaxID=9596 RepID=A0A2I3REQ4_PANTR|nr:TMTC4 isoform 9 [Pan troglodytes]